MACSQGRAEESGRLNWWCGLMCSEDTNIGGTGRAVMGSWTSARALPFLVAASHLWCVRNAIPKLFLSQALNWFGCLLWATMGSSVQQNSLCMKKTIFSVCYYYYYFIWLFVFSLSLFLYCQSFLLAPSRGAVRREKNPGTG